MFSRPVRPSLKTQQLAPRAHPRLPRQENRVADLLSPLLHIPAKGVAGNLRFDHIFPRVPKPGFLSRRRIFRPTVLCVLVGVWGGVACDLAFDSRLVNCRSRCSFRLVVPIRRLSVAARALLGLVAPAALERPTLAEIPEARLSTHPRMSPLAKVTRSRVAQHLLREPSVAQIWPSLAHIGPNLVDFGQCWTELNQFEPTLAKGGRSRPQ